MRVGSSARWFPGESRVQSRVTDIVRAILPERSPETANRWADNTNARFLITITRVTIQQHNRIAL